MEEKPKKRYVVHCDACGNNLIISQAEDVVGMHEYKTSKIPGGIPNYDVTTKKIVEKKSAQRRKMFRCSNCGRGIVVRAYLTPATELPKEEVKKDGTNEQENFNVGREVGFAGPEIPGSPA